MCICSHTCGQPCTAIGMAAWGCGRDTLTGAADVSVWTAAVGASTDTTCCSAATAGVQPGINFTHLQLVVMVNCCIFSMTTWLPCLHISTNQNTAALFGLTNRCGVLGHSQNVLSATNLRMTYSLSHFLRSFAFTFIIGHWWWQRCINLYLKHANSLMAGHHNDLQSRYRA